MYDLIIVGSGPAGYSAAIYASRYGLKVLVVTKERGGLLSKIGLIENYPGFKSVSGYKLLSLMDDQVREHGVEIIDDIIESCEVSDDNFVLRSVSKKEYNSRALIIATGSKRRKLNVPGEDRLLGKGVSYCATCDGMFFKGKDVCVVGGSDSAVKEALFLANICNKVYVIYRGDKLRAEPISIKKLEEAKNIEVLYNTNVLEIIGESSVEKVKLDREFNGSKELPVAAVFVEIGQEPNSRLAESLGCELNEKGEVVVDRYMRTSVPRVYAAGDVVDFEFKQVVTAAAQGSIAAWSCYCDLN